MSFLSQHVRGNAEAEANRRGITRDSDGPKRFKGEVPAIIQKAEAEAIRNKGP